MKICIAQTLSVKGKIQENIQNHFQIIEKAVKLNASVIIFPELSITNYEPSLAQKLAVDIENTLFSPFQELSDKNEITIGIGTPTKTNHGVHISMLIFQPKKQRTVYTKGILHIDELPFFSKGKKQPLLDLNENKIAIGICYETLQREHFIKAKKNKATIYIASVAKSDKGINKAYTHFSEISKEFKTPILMSNCVGYCDDFLSNGKSAIWNKNGELIGQLDDVNQGIMIYDTVLGIVKISYN